MLQQPAFVNAQKSYRFTPLVLLAIIVLGAALRFYLIGSKGLWLDEAFSVWMGQQPLSDMFSWLLRIDHHPPLYYILLHFWIGLGDSAAVVRAFSALVGTLTIPVIYLVGRRLVNWKAGLLAALILALSPFHVRFAQETRMYTLLTFNAAIAILALAHLLTGTRSTTIPIGQQLLKFYQQWQTSGPYRQPLHLVKTDLAWLGLIIFTVATLLTHNTAIFFPLAINLFVFGLIIIHKFWPNNNEGQLQPPSLKNWMIAQVITFLLWSPWLGAFVSQVIEVDREFWIWEPDYDMVMGTLGTFLSAMLPDQIKSGGLVWYVYGLVLFLGVIYFRKQPAHIALLLILFLTPFVGELLVSLRRPIFYDRTLIWATIPLYLLLAAGLMQLRFQPFIVAGLAALIVFNSYSLHEYFYVFEKEEWDDAAAYVAEHVENEDLLLFNASWVQIPFDFYFRYYNRPVKKHGVPADLFDRGILEPKMTRADLPRMVELTRDHRRVWLIYSHNWYTDPQNLIPVGLGRNLKLLDKQHFYGLEVHLYSARRLGCGQRPGPINQTYPGTTSEGQTGWVNDRR